MSNSFKFNPIDIYKLEKSEFDSLSRRNKANLVAVVHDPSNGEGFDLFLGGESVSKIEWYVKDKDTGEITRLYPNDTETLENQYSIIGISTDRTYHNVRQIILQKNEFDMDVVTNMLNTNFTNLFTKTHKMFRKLYSLLYTEVSPEISVALYPSPGTYEINKPLTITAYALTKVNRGTASKLDTLNIYNLGVFATSGARPSVTKGTEVIASTDRLIASSTPVSFTPALNIITQEVIDSSAYASARNTGSVTLRITAQMEYERNDVNIINNSYQDVSTAYTDVSIYGRGTRTDILQVNMDYNFSYLASAGHFPEEITTVSEYITRREGGTLHTTDKYQASKFTGQLGNWTSGDYVYVCMPKSYGEPKYKDDSFSYTMLHIADGEYNGKTYALYRSYEKVVSERITIA